MITRGPVVKDFEVLALTYMQLPNVFIVRRQLFMTNPVIIALREMVWLCKTSNYT